MQYYMSWPLPAHFLCLDSPNMELHDLRVYIYIYIYVHTRIYIYIYIYIMCISCTIYICNYSDSCTPIMRISCIPII